MSFPCRSVRSRIHFVFLGALGSLLTLAAAGATDYAEAAGVPEWMPKVLGMQFNGVYQNVPGFKSPYVGPNSFRTTDGRGRDFTHTYGVYLGSQLASALQAYLDVEMFRGNGVGVGTGLAGYANGDVIRAGSSDLPRTPYVARLYLRYVLPLSSKTERVERAMDQLPGDEAVARCEVKVGKFTLTDDFDQNRYANNNRTQFLNYDFLYNTAWDYAADTRGYSYGAVAAVNQPRWRLALGVFMEPNTANGADFDTIDTRELGYNIELTLKPNNAGTVMRLLAYFNEARMGSYDAALSLGRATSTVPDLLKVEIQGGTKFGFGLNFEQPVADDGETGVFARIGWNNGVHETWAYTESDRHASLGIQVSGAQWGRKNDAFGVGYGVNALSGPHREYLAAGGSGILLGDGRLNYGHERVIEAYYRVQLGTYVQLSPDFQRLENPGYNHDRGPAQVYSLRLRLSL